MKSVKLNTKEITINGVEYIQADLSKLPDDIRFIDCHDSYLKMNCILERIKIKDKIINIPK